MFCRAGQAIDTELCVGWDEGILQMSLGEKATLTISAYVASHWLFDFTTNVLRDYGYGTR
jgi:hypothetical protein